MTIFWIILVLAVAIGLAAAFFFKGVNSASFCYEDLAEMLERAPADYAEYAEVYSSLTSGACACAR